MDTVFCPVANRDIDGGDCVVICDVADRMIKPTVLPEDIQWDEEQRAKCLAPRWGKGMLLFRLTYRSDHKQRPLRVLPQCARDLFSLLPFCRIHNFFAASSS